MPSDQQHYSYNSAAIEFGKQIRLTFRITQLSSKEETKRIDVSRPEGINPLELTNLFTVSRFYPLRSVSIFDADK